MIPLDISHITALNWLNVTSRGCYVGNARYVSICISVSYNVMWIRCESRSGDNQVWIQLNPDQMWIRCESRSGFVQLMVCEMVGPQHIAGGSSYLQVVPGDAAGGLWAWPCMHNEPSVWRALFHMQWQASGCIPCQNATPIGHNQLETPGSDHKF